MASILEKLTENLTISKYDDWAVFAERLEKAINSGLIRKVPVLKPVWSRWEEWYLEVGTGEICAYYPPDDRGNPLWRRLDVIAHLEAPDPPPPPPLSIFKTGQMSVMTAHMMKLKLEELKACGLVEELPPASSSSEHGTVRWFKDNVSNITYRLIEYFGFKDADDMRWEIVPPNELTSIVQ